jgi:N-hydroxyarylamine O-acetyltransferase
MNDEWDIDQLDLPAYLRRIGRDGETEPTGATLAALHRAHLAAIPFENLDIVLGRGVAVDLESIQRKLVQRGRGGYCYEHGLLFAAALERLGYSVDRLLARVGGEDERPRARTHMTLRVSVGGERWLADVGFGSGLLEPLPFEAGEPRTQGAWTYALAATGPRSWALRERQGSEWITRYQFDDGRQHPADVVMSNHFTSTFARSPFVGRLVAIRKDAESIRGLTGRQFTVTHPDRSVEERRLGDDELGDALRHVFGIRLTDEEVAQLVAASP